jgi:hypothetical protein
MISTFLPERVNTGYLSYWGRCADGTRIDDSDVGTVGVKLSSLAEEAEC